MPATYDSIATTTLGSANTTITFSNIPNTYTDLRLIFVGRTSSGADTLMIRFNGNTGTVYSRTYIHAQPGYPGTPLSGRSTDQSSIDVMGVQSLKSTQPEMVTLDIFSYASSNNKTVLATYAADLNGNGSSVASTVALARITSAISSISLVILNPDMAAGTTATLYGILRA